VANGRNPRKRIDVGRDAGGFVALPWSVLDCPAFSSLSHPARSLMIEFARQLGRNNNGRLLASAAYLLKRGWRSVDVITRAKRDLIDAGFIFETVKGHRPNKASWYAVTWYALDKLDGFDAGAEKAFERSSYMKVRQTKINSLMPPDGLNTIVIEPSNSIRAVFIKPSNGAIKDDFDSRLMPFSGDHLDMPSVGNET